MRPEPRVLPALALALALTGCAGPDGGQALYPSALEVFEAGGDFTVADGTSAAYSLPAPGLTPAALARHQAGDAAFEARYVTAPAPVNPGLGPGFNSVSCLACHKGDGGGRAPEDGSRSEGLLFRVSLPGAEGQAPVPVPGFGVQIQDRAVAGQQPEAIPETTYAEYPVRFTDGTTLTLRRPHHALTAPKAPLPEGVLLSPRLSAPLVGLGLLEAVSDATYVALADPDDRDGDGVSGRVNWVSEAGGAPRVGRFGWKAAVPTLEDQIAGAFHQDMGLTSGRHPHDATGAPDAPPELAEETLADIAFYLRTLGVPARREAGTESARRGAALFTKLGCASCHTPTLVTGADAQVAELRHQVLHPYTDGLVHDMGPELADDRPDFGAGGREWRTPALWGLGLRKRVQGHSDMLHDGRARNATEAVAWHGGEARKARDGFLALSAAEREDLARFLDSL